MFTRSRNHTWRLTHTSALLGGLIVAIGLAAPGLASADGGDSPPITLPPGFVLPPTSDLVVSIPPITIPPTSDPVISVPPITIPPTSDPVITLPTDVTIVPDTTETTVPTTTPPTSDPAVQPPPPPPAPMVPSAPQYTAAKPGASSVKLTWAAPASNGGAAIDGYAVQRATSAAGPFANVGFPTSTSFLNNTGMTIGVKYYFRIVAHNAVGWSAPSTVVSATPFTFPSTPMSLVATPVAHGIKLTWLEPLSNGLSPIVGYHVAVYTANCATKVDDIYILGNGTNFSKTYSVANGTTRCFKVQASNSAGYGPLSNWSTAMAGRPTAPAPCSMTYQPSYWDGYPGYVYITWSEPASYGGYSSSGFYGSGYRVTITNGQVEMDVTETDEWFTWNNPVAGTWWAEISAVNADGDGLVCTTNTVTID